MSFKTPTPFLRGRTYYFRLRVPQDLLPVYDPKKELTFSLKTRDFHQALENARLRAIQLDQEFREHRRRLAEQHGLDRRGQEQQPRPRTVGLFEPVQHIKG